MQRSIAIRPMMVIFRKEVVMPRACSITQKTCQAAKCACRAYWPRIHIGPSPPMMSAAAKPAMKMFDVVCKNSNLLIAITVKLFPKRARMPSRVRTIRFRTRNHGGSLVSSRLSSRARLELLHDAVVLFIVRLELSQVKLELSMVESFSMDLLLFKLCVIALEKNVFLFGQMWYSGVR